MILMKRPNFVVCRFLAKLPEGKGLAMFDYDKKMVIENRVKIGKIPYDGKNIGLRLLQRMAKYQNK